MLSAMLLGIVIVSFLIVRNRVASSAVSLLERGTSISETAFELGYFDQAHLTNSLKRLIGRTPAQIARKSKVG